MSKLTLVRSGLVITSLDIAEMVESRHADVKRSIDRLITNGVIRQTAVAFSEIINNLGFAVAQEHYVFSGPQGKRDSIVAIAQLSPEFTARLVDRWQELEDKLAAPSVLSLENQSKVEAYDKLFASEAEVPLDVTAQVLGFGRNTFYKELRNRKILTQNNRPYQQHLNAGRFAVHFSYEQVRGNNFYKTFVFVTAKGVLWLEELFRPVLKLA